MRGCSKIHTLTKYFKGPYKAGELFGGSKYQYRHDNELHIDVLVHCCSGIKVWDMALDLTGHGAAGAVRVLYHYTNRMGFASIAGRSKKDVEVLASLEDQATHFGCGVYTTSKEPDAFGSKDEVLLNNYWPRCGDRNEGEQHEANVLARTGLMSANPHDPQNSETCRAILSNPKRRDCADYCIPIIAPAGLVYDIWQRAPPDLASRVPGLGYNKWGELQWRGRDVKVLQVSEGAQLCSGRASAEGKVLVMWMRIELSEERRGRYAPATLRCRRELAALFAARGRFEDAEGLSRQAFEASKKAFGPRHHETLTCISQLAPILEAQGKLEEAEHLYWSAREGWERAYGLEHPRALETLSKLVLPWQLRGDLSAAEDQSLLATDCLAYALGPEHLDTLASMCKLISALVARGKVQEAEAVAWRVLEARERKLGPQHPDTLASMNRLASLLCDPGELGEAERLTRRALKDQARLLGREHVETLASVSSLASLLELQGDIQGAERLSREALLGRESSLGEEHPDTILSTISLAALLAGRGPAAEAQRLGRLALRRLADGRRAALLQVLRGLEDAVHLGCGPRGGAAEAPGGGRAAGARRLDGLLQWWDVVGEGRSLVHAAAAAAPVRPEPGTSARQGGAHRPEPPADAA